jgi:WbqC-like protein family
VTTVTVLQPGFLPWLGFFDQMIRCDVFVYYDDVQFDKHGWRNRNRIKGPSGPLWVTVPVLHSGRQGQRIVDAEIDNSRQWGCKIIAGIRQYYARAPYLAAYLPGLEELLSAPWHSLADLDLASADLLCGWLGIKRPTYRSSALGIDGGKSSRLLSICQHFSATNYLSGNAAQAYLDVGLFEKAGIGVEWQNYFHPTYLQLHGDFVSHLSALDLVLNAGPHSISILRGYG